jgi:hypothetical protein
LGGKFCSAVVLVLLEARQRGIQVMQVHGTRMDPGNLAVVALRPRPHVVAGHLTVADLQAVSQWIALNETAILNHWNGLTDGAELAQQLRRLP